MHDLLFAYDFPPMGGGIARWMEAIAQGYPAGTLTVSTGALPGSAASDERMPQHVDRIAVHAERLRTVQGLLAWSRRAVTLGRDPRARFAWCDTVRPAGYPAYWSLRRTGLPYGILVVGGDLLTLRQKVARSVFKRRVMRSILGDAAVLVAISHWTAELCRTILHDMHLDAAMSRVRIVTLGTDPARWRPDPMAAAAFCRRRGLPAGRWLVTVARLVGYKGIDDGIRLLARLVADHPDLHYAVVGRGPYQASLRALSVELGVANRVHLLTDVADDELCAAYSIGEIYLGLTRETATDVEGFGLSFVEAAACQLPVVATRSGGIPDAVKDGETALLTEPGNLNAVVAAVDRLLQEPTLARRMGQAGRALVERYHNWTRVVMEMRQIARQHERGGPV
ncbi:MAG: glycosyltransferase family 4 protein [Gemmatimonadales bacterium]